MAFHIQDIHINSIIANCFQTLPVLTFTFNCQNIWNLQLIFVNLTDFTNCMSQMTSMTLITGIINIISENIMSYFSNEMICGNPQKSANIQICFIKLEAILFKLKKKSICIYGKHVKGNVIFWGSQWRYLQLIYLTVA